VPGIALLLLYQSLGQLRRPIPHQACAGVGAVLGLEPSTKFRHRRIRVLGRIGRNRLTQRRQLAWNENYRQDGGIA
jgi:hypothetical protein